MKNQIKGKTIKPLPYGRHKIDSKDIKAVTDVLKSDFLTSGPKSNEFELEFSRFINSKYSVVFSSGTAALHIAGMALGIKEGDFVIVPSITFLATANAFRFLGAKILFCDVDPETGLLSTDVLEKLITDNNKKKIKAIVSVHLNGQPTNLEKIQKIAKKNNLIHIEDACHALGATYKHSKIGDCTYSDVTMFSFHPVKLMAMGEGGVICTNSKIIESKLKLLRNHGIERNPNNFLNADLAFEKNGSPKPWYYEMQYLGYNYRASDIHCALGISQLKKVEEFLKKRKHLSRLYDQKFKNLDSYLKILKKVEWGESGHHLYVIQIDFEKKNITKSDFVKFLASKGIFTQVHYIPLIYQPYYKTQEMNKFPGSIKYYENSLSIPLFPLMDKNDIEFVTYNIGYYLSNNK